MASQRQIQDKQESTKEDSLGIKDAQQVESQKVEAKPKKSAKSAKLADPDPADDAEPAQKLELLSQLLKGEISESDPNAALKAIDEMHGLLQKVQQPEAKEIATMLKELQKLLKQKEPNGHELGELIGHLGEKTTEIATQSEPGLKTPLQHLGKQLNKLGRSLSKSEDLEYLEGLDAIVDILEQKPKKIDLKYAIISIDLWYEILHKSEDQSLKLIATELKDLKQLLKADKQKAAEISQKLIQIGELTTATAATAGRGFKGVIQKLGKVLSTFGKSMA
jgi:translation initiation factor 2B subunit (eIF-2B alpha/beta/delta family)